MIIIEYGASYRAAASPLLSAGHPLIHVLRRLTSATATDLPFAAFLFV